MAVKKIFVAYVDIKTLPHPNKPEKRGKLKILILSDAFYKVQPAVENHLKTFLKEENAKIERIKFSDISYDAFIQAK